MSKNLICFIFFIFSIFLESKHFYAVSNLLSRAFGFKEKINGAKGALLELNFGIVTLC